MRSQVGFEPEQRSSHQYLCIDFRTLHGELETVARCLHFKKNKQKNGMIKIEMCPPRIRIFELKLYEQVVSQFNHLCTRGDDMCPDCSCE